VGVVMRRKGLGTQAGELGGGGSSSKGRGIRAGWSGGGVFWLRASGLGERADVREGERVTLLNGL
jgi:hypothetical protein